MLHRLIHSYIYFYSTTSVACKNSRNAQHKKTLLMITKFILCMYVFVTLVACQSDFANGILWNATKRNQTSSLKCSSLHSNFRDGLQITRSCNSDGSWSSVNVIDCTMLITSPSLVILSVILSEDTQQNYSQLAENVSLSYVL